MLWKAGRGGGASARESKASAAELAIFATLHLKLNVTSRSGAPTHSSIWFRPFLTCILYPLIKPTMAALIPPLDFSRSPSSFRTAAESPTDEHGDDHSVASTPTPAPREAFNSPDDEATEWSEAADEVPELGDSAEHKRRCSIRSQHSGKMLVKRNKSQKLQKRLSSTSEQAPRSYRVSAYYHVNACADRVTDLPVLV